jgi:hypothetical protein
MGGTGKIDGLAELAVLVEPATKSVASWVSAGSIGSIPPPMLLVVDALAQLPVASL